MTEQIVLEEGEQILKTVRKHWFVLFVRTFGLFVAALLPLIAIGGVMTSDAALKFLPPPSAWGLPVLFFATAWLLIVWMMLFTVWTDYYLDAWVLTNRRIIAIDQLGFFNRQVASFRLERLQDMTVTISGLIETMLDFGKLEADTASETNFFVIDGIPDPRGIKAMIQESADKLMPMPREMGTAPATLSAQQTQKEGI